MHYRLKTELKKVLSRVSIHTFLKLLRRNEHRGDKRRMRIKEMKRGRKEQMELRQKTTGDGGGKKLREGKIG